MILDIEDFDILWFVSDLFLFIFINFKLLIFSSKWE